MIDGEICSWGGAAKPMDNPMIVEATQVRSDGDLLAATRRGDDDAYGELFSRHLGVAMSAARARTKNAHVAEDAVADAFANVLRSIRRGGGPDINFRPYLLVAVRNALTDGARRKRRETIGVDVDVDDVADVTLFDPSELYEDHSMMALAYSTLPERWQMALWHAEVEGRTSGEIAPMIGLTPNATSALIYRSREGLRRAYMQAHSDSGVSSAGTCRGHADRLPAYVRGSLPDEDRDLIEAHLRTCPTCSVLLADLEQVSTKLAGVLAPMVVGMSADKFSAALTAKPAGGWFGVVRNRPRRLPRHA